MIRFSRSELGDECFHRALDAQAIPAPDHDLPHRRACLWAIDERQIVMLEWNVDTRASRGMGSQAEDIEYADIAVRDLRQANSILQRQPLMTCKPHVRWPFTPLRGAQAIEHHEGEI